MDGFKEGHFFEVTKADLGIDIIDQEVDMQSKSKDPKDAHSNQQKFGRFSKWTQGVAKAFKAGDGGYRLYPVEMKPVKITRQLDVASPLLFRSCFYTSQFASAALVLRRSKGIHFQTGQTRGFGHMPFLRIDFKTVLIVSMDWDISDNIVEEEFEFVCRDVWVRYQGQKSDGEPDPNLKGDTKDYLSLQKANANGDSG